MSKVILITGASSGIGKATALRLLKEGHIVYGAARRVENMKELHEAGGNPMKMDITVQADISSTVAGIIEREGRIDVLINNAGYGSYGAVETVPIEEARRQFEVNLFGLGRLTQLVLPHMRKQNNGWIINVSSMGGKLYTPLGAWYHASKHALEGFSDCLRFELKQFGIHVVIIEPGSIQSEWSGIAQDQMEETSLNTAYEPLTQKVLKKFRVSGGASSPDVIAQAIVDAINSDTPKTRYVAGKYARPFLFMRWLLPDRWFDNILNKEFEIKS